MRSCIILAQRNSQAYCLLSLNTMGLHRLFSTPVWQFECPSEFKGEISKITPILLGLRDLQSDQGKSVRNGWRLNNPLKIKGLEPIDAYLNKLCGSVLHATGMPLDRPYSLSSWTNLHDQHGYNALHHHGSALFSGVLYLSTPPGSGELRLRDPRPALGYITRPDPPAGQNAHFYPSEYFVIKPSVGLSVVFPGWLEHSVESSNTGGEPRLSVAFNLTIP